MIGLPAGLFYGTGIPACVLVMNKKGANQRKSALFINADREYKEGKNQNSLRPEDIEKIAHVFRHHLDVPVSELEPPDWQLTLAESGGNLVANVRSFPSSWRLMLPWQPNGITDSMIDRSDRFHHLF